MTCSDAEREQGSSKPCCPTSQCGGLRRWKVAALAVFLVVVATSLTRGGRATVPEGEYHSVTSGDTMIVTRDSVRLREGKSTWATLPNCASGRRLYDADDLAKAHPQRLKLLGDGQVEYIREASPPFPEQRLTFVRKAR